MKTKTNDTMTNVVKTLWLNGCKVVVLENDNTATVTERRVDVVRVGHKAGDLFTMFVKAG
jgi:hypothetical protein